MAVEIAQPSGAAIGYFIDCTLRAFMEKPQQVRAVTAASDAVAGIDAVSGRVRYLGFLSFAAARHCFRASCRRNSHAGSFDLDCAKPDFCRRN